MIKQAAVFLVDRRHWKSNGTQKADRDSWRFWEDRISRFSKQQESRPAAFSFHPPLHRQIVGLWIRELAR